MAKSGPASSLYAPGEVPRGSQARPRWPLAADSPPVRPVWTWVARGLIGGAALQSTAVDGGDGGTRRLAAAHRAHIGVLSRRDRPAGGRDRLQPEGRLPKSSRAASPALRQTSLQHAMTRCWTSAPAELHSIVNTPSCLAQPRTSPSPCSSRRSDSDRTMWISSLPCECVDAVNGRGRRAIDFGKTSRARRWGRRHAADDIPGGGESRPTTARTGRRSPLGSPNHRSPSRVCGARVSVRMIRSRCEAHRSIARAKPLLGGRVRAGGGHARSRETRPSDLFVQ